MGGAARHPIRRPRATGQRSFPEREEGRRHKDVTPGPELRLGALPLFFVVAILMATSRTNDEFHALVRRAVGGNAQAVRLLIRQLTPVIRARVRTFLAGRKGRQLDALDADDLVQDIWAKLLHDDARLLRDYDPERGATPQGYVGRLAQREIWNRFQKTLAQKAGGGRMVLSLEGLDPSRSGDVTPERTAVARQLLGALSAHLEQVLPERGREVLRLLYTETLPPNEVASRLSVRVQVIYNWQHRIRKESRAFLDTWG